MPTISGRSWSERSLPLDKSKCSLEEYLDLRSQGYGTNETGTGRNPMIGEETETEKGENLVNALTIDRGIATIEMIGTTKTATELGTKKETVVEIVTVREIEPATTIVAETVAAITIVIEVGIVPVIAIVRWKERETRITKAMVVTEGVLGTESTIMSGMIVLIMGMDIMITMNIKAGVNMPIRVGRVIMTGIENPAVIMIGMNKWMRMVMVVMMNELHPNRGMSGVRIGRVLVIMSIKLLSKKVR
ncbi:hypothetical protein PHJA_002810400 [Phtheirospermum japonicum]|uniref:Uncharacterized protein n=1 Tax=Phtheirospermum japonicum TaxID=374723 RepID=A0A830DFD9_9LAMI|nr:hypothetical protein PHJA_002810400 [Phtheirospermum japonicum]